MRLLALTYGTEGDTRPLVMLCHGLRQAGHEVMLLAEQGTLGSARDLGVPHAALEGDIHDEVVALVARGNNLAAASRGLGRMSGRHVPAWMAQADAAAAGCDAILTGGLAALVGLSVAERHDLPAIGTGMIPLTPTRVFASPFLPPLPLPGFLRRASYGLVNQAVWRTFRKPINVARAALGQAPRRTLWTGLPMLYGISPQLLPPPPDWPADHVVCGQWRMPEQPWLPPPDLQAFLDAGPPPVYLGFGSMTGFDRERVLPALLHALAPRRVLLFPGWAGLPAGDLPANVFVVGPTPHEALFPRCALAIHHGGSGTTHSACRAGIPSLVMPFAADQFFWARRLQALGVAPAPLSPKRLHAATLATAIAFAEDPETRARAAALGAAMASEDGVATAVAAIDGNRPYPPPDVAVER
ncbi:MULTISPECIES: glycosyltransferase [Stenotrophomonas]|uniref:nucleotide disphospho-sugar-binding domain-containing protein n=1 Tax=Stenotrophomonas TaxID=40323 RepID=UPI000D53F58C|nr:MULTISPECIES: glycosyltransferase [Stenotrophomonas]AWH23269.1 glycosyltransferase [Stenotrophomonas sp. ZAC14D2_NAIMI4_6]